MTPVLEQAVPDGGHPFAGYSDEEKPLTSYAVLVGLFNAAFAVFLLARKRSHADLPDRTGG